jgi:predicted dehydrogenase
MPQRLLVGNDGEGTAHNLVFLGCGQIAKWHSIILGQHRREVRSFYASRDVARARSYNQQFRGSGFFEDYDSALSDPRIQTAIVLTPPFTHLELTLRALKAGKNVVVEKPAFLSSSDFDIVRQAISETGGQVLIAENYFYKPLVRKLREIIASHALGEILYIYINALKMQKNNDWRNNDRLAGGGALFEGGVHWLNMMANLGLTIRSVHGMRAGSANALEQTMLVSIRYAEGAAGMLAHSWEIPAPFHFLRLSKIYGRKGSATFESNGLFLFVNGSRKLFLVPSMTDITGHRAMWRDFVYCLRTGAEPQMTLEQAEQDIRRVEAIYNSADVS